VPQVY